MWSIFLINCFLLFAGLERVHSEPSLQFVFVTTRGGEHEPCNYPGGPLFKDLKINETQSHLTEAGRQTALKLGQKLSEMYKSPLDVKQWDQTNYWSFAGNAVRNQEAAIILGDALQNKKYDTKKRWNSEELLKTQFPSIDYYFKFLNKNECPAIWNELQKQMKDVSERLRKEYKSSITKVEQEYENIHKNNSAHIWITYETVQRLKHSNKKPEWWTDDIESNLKAYSEKFLHEALTKSEKLTRLSGGPILTDILKDIDEIRVGKGQPVSNIKKGVSVFTTSQSVLAAQLAAFSPRGTKFGNEEITDEMFYPDIGATHILELYKEVDKWRVKMMYRNGENKKYETIKLPDCEDMCPLKKFKEILNKYKLTKKEQKKQCKTD